MKKLTLLLPAAAVLGMAGVAIAAPGQGRMPQGDMTRAQAQARAEAGFAKMDVNGDGKLDQADRAAMRDKMFDRIDTDGNGQISRAEFAAMAEMHHGKNGHDKHMRMGKRMGMGKDGQMTRTAFVDRAMTMFDKADTNHDGTVTQAERKAARDAMRQQWQARREARQQG